MIKYTKISSLFIVPYTIDKQIRGTEGSPKTPPFTLFYIILQDI